MTQLAATTISHGYEPKIITPPKMAKHHHPPHQINTKANRHHPTLSHPDTRAVLIVDAMAQKIARNETIKAEVLIL